MTNSIRLTIGVSEEAIKDVCTTYVDDIENVDWNDMKTLESRYTNNELILHLLSYVLIKKSKGKKAYLSKFVKKMSK